MEYWGLSDTGRVRAQNQDAFRIEELDRHTVLAVVCDGMGGAKSGNIASRLAIDVFVDEVVRSYKSSMNQEQLEQLLQGAVKLANFTVYDQAQQFEDFAGMGTTLVAALLSGKNATVVNVGDSRCYHITREDIRRITVDHSLVQMMVDRGDLTAEEARDYPGKNYITRAVGTEPTVESDVFAIRVERGDALLLSSDGLHNEVDDQEILFEVVHGVNNDNCCQRLLDIANMRGSPDNVTSVLVMA
ncbi:MAG: Stp1/IreP family PP2C-type Ser/Thr phosphatase [Ruminococcaceae bacterium]|nr:Stp1/IreP family PP2C-type Ser/Thr phosphatase [Oscillospiraceae bacterium]